MFLLQGGCASTPSPLVRFETAQQLASEKLWDRYVINSEEFDLTVFAPVDVLSGGNPGENTLTVYIEGDGHAWHTRTRPSDNPTPVEPVGLKLALQHPGQSVAYLGRPCQYTGAEANSACVEKVWTSHRFSPEVIESINGALSDLKRVSGTKMLQLVGYSGGGAIAAIVAAKRDDVASLLTVAGNLDHNFWTKEHNITPLEGSLNAADFAGLLVGKKQVHFLGSADKNIMPGIGDSFRKRFPEEAQPEVILISEFTHNCCWVEQWPNLYREASKRLKGLGQPL